jgi:hypothetical protein
MYPPHPHINAEYQVTGNTSPVTNLSHAPIWLIILITSWLKSNLSSLPFQAQLISLVVYREGGLVFIRIKNKSAPQWPHHQPLLFIEHITSAN